MKKIFCTILILSLSFLLMGQDIKSDQILEKIDDNMVIQDAVMTSEMTIHSRMGTRTIKSKSWIKNANTSLVEYLSPPREEGKKMLKTGNKLWIYTPEPNNRIISISGHLLNQSVMGSDLSYEDFMEEESLSESYSSEIIGQEKIDGRECYILKLEATVSDVNYHSRKIWVDKERWLPLKEERYAKSGKLLKKTEILDVFQVKDRWYPKKIRFKDMLSEGKGTVYKIESLKLDQNIPEIKFTKAALRR